TDAALTPADFPGGDAARLSGLPARSPGKAQSAAPGRSAQNVTEFPGGDAAHLSGLPDLRRW
ncbi:hypothetical protein MM809_38480, partial [Klebsiella pneumoniae]|nr:hypothetical protein [Klebsiella pneumoniae]